MSKIKLLILLSFSFILGSCTSTNRSNYQFKLDYIGGGADGLIYSNYLNAYLKSLNMFNNSSDYSIDTSMTHQQTVFITNVNNTSDREMITSKIVTKINDNLKNCIVLEYSDDVQQQYVIASNINFTSNNKAVNSIKRSNTEILTKKMVYFLSQIENFECVND